MAAKLGNDASISTITTIPDADYILVVDDSTGELSKITAANAKIDFDSGGTLVYVAIISQSSTSAPTATIILNTLGTTITFSRNIAGDYNATAGASVFTSAKTAIFITNGNITQSIGAIRTSDTVINFVSAGDGNLQNASFKIEVYP
jgi:hypothetical protein